METILICAISILVFLICLFIYIKNGKQKGQFKKQQHSQNSHILYAHLRHITTELLELTDVFPDKNQITKKNYESAFTFAYTIFAIHDETHKNRIGQNTFISALNEFENELRNQHGYTNDSIINFKKDLTQNGVKITEAFRLLQNNDENSLENFAKTVLSLFPTAETQSPYSMAAISFLNFYMSCIEYISESYNKLLNENNNKTEKHINLKTISFICIFCFSVLCNVFLLYRTIDLSNKHQEALKNAHAYHEDYLEAISEKNKMKDMVIVDIDSWTYHRPDCPQTKFRIMDQGTAFAVGFTPCDTCFNTNQ